MDGSDPAQQSTSAHDPYAAFRIAAFRLYIVSFGLAAIGSQSLTTAIQWTVFKQGNGADPSDVHAALRLALLSLMSALPVLCLSIVSGQVADRFNRKRLLLATQAILVACPAALAVLSATGHLTNWLVYPIILANGVALVFGRPARATLLPFIVPREHYTNAVTWNTTTFEVSNIAGPFLAGAIMAFTSPAIALAISALSMGTCMLLTCFLPDPGRPAGQNKVTLETALAGVRFVYRNKVLWAAMNLDLWAVLLGGATVLLPIYAHRLGVEAFGLGAFRGAMAAGALSMALYQAHRPPLNRAGKTMLTAVAMFGLSMIVFGVSTSFWLSLFALFMTGMMDNVSVVVRQSLVQLLTPDSMRGRVSAVNQVFVGSSNDIGNIEAALLAAWLGPVVSVVTGGVGTILVVLLIAAKYPQVRRLGRLKDVVPQAEAAPVLGETP